MALANCTITLQETINWAQAFLGYVGLNLGASNEPAITSANLVIRTMLSPPFRWRWNRKEVVFPTAVGVQDYSVQVNPGIGLLEKGYVVLSGLGVEVESKAMLAVEVQQARPVYLAAQYDDDNGNIKFRFSPVPDQIYTTTVTYQAFPPTVAALTSAWAPIPDAYQHVYSWGFLSLMYEYFGSPRAAFARQIFIGSLLSVADGLTEEEKSLFEKIWVLRSSRAFQTEAMAAQSAHSTQALIV